MHLEPVTRQAALPCKMVKCPFRAQETKIQGLVPEDIMVI